MFSNGTAEFPTIVEIQRPNAGTEWLSIVIGKLLTMFFRAWIVMLLVGALGFSQFGYWQVFAGIWVIRLIFVEDGAINYMRWTRPRIGKR